MIQSLKIVSGGSSQFQDFVACRKDFCFIHITENERIRSFYQLVFEETSLIVLKFEIMFLTPHWSHHWLKVPISGNSRTLIESSNLELLTWCD